MLPVDVSVDHSVGVDSYGSAGRSPSTWPARSTRNARTLPSPEMGDERARSCDRASAGHRHHAHHESGASLQRDRRDRGRRRPWAVPDTLIGTDSHTPMVNGIGVLGWGVGGLEAESVMFGMPVTLRIPEVVGVRLDGQLPEGVSSTDLALTVTQRAFARMASPASSSSSTGRVSRRCPRETARSSPTWRRNMAPPPATSRSTPRRSGTCDPRDEPADLLERVEALARGQGLWFQPDSPRATPM